MPLEDKNAGIYGGEAQSAVRGPRLRPRGGRVFLARRIRESLVANATAGGLSHSHYFPGNRRDVSRLLTLPRKTSTGRTSVAEMAGTEDPVESAPSRKPRDAMKGGHLTSDIPRNQSRSNEPEGRTPMHGETTAHSVGGAAIRQAVQDMQDGQNTKNGGVCSNQTIATRQRMED